MGVYQMMNNKSQIVIQELEKYKFKLEKERARIRKKYELVLPEKDLSERDKLAPVIKSLEDVIKYVEAMQ
jgi:hypothetical protein